MTLPARIRQLLALARPRSIEREARRISGKWRRRLSRIDERLVTLEPEGEEKGDVLVSYILDAFLLRPGEPVPHSHTKQWESWEIARAFVDLGYRVDAVSWKNASFRPEKPYRAVVDPRLNLERWAPLLPSECVKIMHVETSHWAFHNPAQAAHLESLRERRGTTLRPQKRQCGGVVTCMHAGLIPLVSDRTGVPMDPSYGVVLPDVEVATLEEAVRELSGRDEVTLADMSRAARRYVRDHHTREHFAAAYREVAAEILRTSRRSPEMTADWRYDAIYLSPHLDDAVLSCGGQIHRQVVARARVLVVTLFAGDVPGGPLSEIAREILHYMGLEPGNAMAFRRREDERACGELGADFEHRRLQESVYRRSRSTGEVFYGDRGSIFGEPATGDAELVGVLQDKLRQLPPAAKVYSPLGVGSHVDHLLLRQAAEEAFGGRLAYYEDFPYVQRFRALGKALGRKSKWRSEVVALAPEDVAARVRAPPPTRARCGRSSATRSGWRRPSGARCGNGAASASGTAGSARACAWKAREGVRRSRHDPTSRPVRNQPGPEVEVAGPDPRTCRPARGSGGVEHELVVLRDLELPESGREGASSSAVARELRGRVARATHVVFAVAIYNYDASSAAKNLLELLTADEMYDKIVGFVCAAGGRSSYMSGMGFANSLMLDFRAWIVPRYVYAAGEPRDPPPSRYLRPGADPRTERIPRQLLSLLHRTAGGPRPTLGTTGRLPVPRR